MTEAKALVLVFIGMILLAAVASVILAVTNAGATAFGLVLVLLAASGGFVSSQVVMHYGSLKERREREEILLR